MRAMTNAGGSANSTSLSRVSYKIVENSRRGYLLHLTRQFMGGLRKAGSLVLILLLFMPYSSPSPIGLETNIVSMFDEGNATSSVDRNPLLASLPIWEIGDSWMYSVSLDAVSLVENSDVEGASLNILTGSATRTVSAIYESSVNGSSPEYIVTTTLGATGTGEFPDPVLGIILTGDLIIGMVETMRVRVSDLAIIHVSRDFDIDFQAGPAKLDMADVIENTSYFPSYEFYDFPIRESDVHFLSILRTTTWEGDGLVSFPGETVDNNTNRETLPAKTVDSALLSFPCASDAVSISEIASDGVLIEEHHYCPDVKNYVYWYTEDVGLNGVKGTFNLISYSLAGSIPGSNSPSSVLVELESDDLGKDVPVNVTIRTESSDGSPLSRTIHLYTMDDMLESSTSNGEVTLSINSTSLGDSTISVDDWSSHAIIACIGHDSSTKTYTACGASEITIQGSAMGAQIRGEMISGIIDIIGDLGRSGEQATRLIRL